jgi:hypothetical protein
MKKHLLLIVAIAMCATAFAQHTQTESKTEITTDKPMLDGKAFTVTLTENTSSTGISTTGTSDETMTENPDLTKRDVEDPQAKKAGAVNSDPKDNRKVLLRFENSTVKISGKGEIKNDKCPYKSWGMESTGISFSADCMATADGDKVNGKSNAGTLLTGTVNGDTIHGNITCTKDDGSVKTFSYTGSKAGPNDLDMENEMGMQ